MHRGRRVSPGREAQTVAMARRTVAELSAPATRGQAVVWVEFPRVVEHLVETAVVQARSMTLEILEHLARALLKGLLVAAAVLEAPPVAWAHLVMMEAQACLVSLAWVQAIVEAFLVMSGKGT